MSQDVEFNLDLSKDLIIKIDEIALRAGWSQEQVIEFILQKYLMRQLTIIEKKAEETNSDMNDLVNQQFVRLVELLRNYPDQLHQN